MSALFEFNPTPPSLCPNCGLKLTKFGCFLRLGDKALIPRYRCKPCKKTVSDATNSPCFGQKKRFLNFGLVKLLGAGYSQRRAALDLGVNRKTVVRKFRFLGAHILENWSDMHEGKPLVGHLQFDEMETFEHTKLKPLSIPVAVEHSTRRILGFAVCQMPARGRLAGLSVQKYGKREDQRGQARRKLFEQLKPLLAPGAMIRSDRNPHYVADVKKHFPGHVHHASKGRRGCVTGQGELKSGGSDPPFPLNHTCTMIRENVGRLSRRTWCTTKLPQGLIYHLAIYAANHNLRLI